ncbi:LAME_0H10088g1_1 [Lachancea meyersii CBS 8951]|uniref:LAME_0H10088g1_1 n=1 Tax=Lachancea meyersii CBS 8951 TaxID=1266667 RepID=A0A1G4KG36_9SACH|nr:LAME_0H10088g1_1 [Lachancea meyersii CBS 8951]
MDEFSNLSLVDKGAVVHEKDLEAILDLKICENDFEDVDYKKRQISQKLMEKLMPHVPSSPSPLRQSTFQDDSNDEMDVDPVDVEEDDNQRLIDYRPSADNELLDELESISDESSQTGPSSKAVIKALLSPTSLGVAAATKLDQPPNVTDKIENDDQYSDYKMSQDQGHMNDLKNSTGVNFTSGELNELRQRSQQQPIQISINNNHFYYPPPDVYATDESLTYDQHDTLKLPNPWSSYSKPASRTSYLLTSYLQIFLNALTALVLFSFALIFMRSIKADLRSAWEVAKLELDHESIQCRIEYDLNHCDRSTRVEALESQCENWGKCMARNNDLFFRARTTISAKLIGDVINSFVEPLGWKTLCVVLSGLAIWCFSSNFLLGFARAKSYYGGSSPGRVAGSQKPVNKISNPSLLMSPDNELLE